MLNVESIQPLFATATLPPTWVTVMFGLLLAGLITCLALEEKLHAKKSVIAGIFAVVCLFLGAACGILPFEEVVVGSHALTVSYTHLTLPTICSV